MNTEQLQQLKELLEKIGYEFTGVEQSITNFDNKQDKGVFVITYKARFNYEVKLEENEQ